MKYFLAVLLLCAASTEHRPQQKVTSVKHNAIKATAVDFVRLKVDSIPQLRFLNKDGSIWKTAVYDDHFSDSSIVPYTMKPEDWLLIQRDTTQGWIRWRDEKGTLLIEIFYDA